MKLIPIRSAESASGQAKPGALITRETARLLPLVGPVALSGYAALAAAALVFAASLPTVAVLGGVLALAVAAVFVEAHPVPIEGVSSEGISLAAVFIVGAAVIYGWAPAVIVGFVAMATIELVQRRHSAIRLLYNSSVYALGGAAAGAAASVGAHDTGVVGLFLEVIVASLAFYAVNFVLIAGIISRWAREPFLPLVRKSLYWTAVPFSIMASVSLMLAVLWERSPLLATALVGPLVAVGLYQRSVYSALKAMRLALTDPLTGLGNHRHFHERLQRDLDKAQTEGFPLTLCLLDIDNFK